VAIKHILKRRGKREEGVEVDHHQSLGKAIQGGDRRIQELICHGTGKEGKQYIIMTKRL